MLNSHLSKNPSKQTIIAKVIGDKGWAYFWDVHFLPRWLPVLLGLGLGVSLAFLIADEAWHFLIPVAFAVPVVVLFTKYPFVGLVVWVAVFPFFVRGTTVADRYIHWIVHRGVIPAALGIVILSDWLKTRKKEPVRFGSAELAMLIFLGLGVVGIFVSTDNPLKMAYKFYDRVFVPFCAYWLIRLAAPRDRGLKLFLWAAFITVVVQSVIGLLAWFAPHLLPPQWLNLAGARTVGTFGNPAVYTSALIFCSLMLYQYAMNCKSKWLRFVLILAFGMAIFCVAYSFSRGSWAGGLVMLAGLTILYPKVTLRLIIILVALVYILSSSVLADQVAFAWERLTGESSIRSAEGRMISSNASLSMIEAKPLWGWGFYNYDRYDYQFYTRVGNIAVTHDGTSHNTYLTIMVEMGLIGFLLYMFPLGWWFMRSIKVWRRLPKKGFWSRSLLVMLGLVMIHLFIVSNFMDTIRFHEFGTTLWWMALGFVANVVYPCLNPGDIRVPGWARRPGRYI